MHRQNYYFLDMIKKTEGLCFPELANIKRTHFVGIAFWGKEWLITQIDRKMKNVVISDMKNTVENNVVIKYKKSITF